jgi:hypothetical protein
MVQRLVQYPPFEIVETVFFHCAVEQLVGVVFLMLPSVIVATTVVIVCKAYVRFVVDFVDNLINCVNSHVMPSLWRYCGQGFALPWATFLFIT